jgi:hypothetical protein
MAIMLISTVGTETTGGIEMAVITIDGTVIEGVRNDVYVFE